MQMPLLAPLGGSRLTEQRVPCAVGVSRDGRTRIALAHVREPFVVTSVAAYDLDGVIERVRTGGVPVMALLPPSTATSLRDSQKDEAIVVKRVLEPVGEQDGA